MKTHVDGCFDLMHSGHFNAIRQASLLCDTLVVATHSNQAITDAKGPPVMTQEERYIPYIGSGICCRKSLDLVFFWHFRDFLISPT